MTFRPSRALRCVGLSIVYLALTCSPTAAWGQEDATPQVQAGSSPSGEPGGSTRIRGPRPSSGGAQPKPEETKPEETKPEPKKEDAKPNEKKEEAKPGETPMGGNKGPIQRKDEPEQPSDPEELKVRPDERGMVRFNFRGQAWPDVLDWLADISNTSLDWQELPGDYLNLTTQRAYTVDEVRDLLNERLMTRGYTILQQQEGLVVAKLEGLNPARVPRVHSEDLRHRDAHEFVKVSFPLSWLMAEDAVEELKPMLSKHGSMSALATSNRLEVLDVVSNLREIQHVLQEEQSTEVRASKVHEFFLRYTRAEDVLAQLQSLLGISKSSGGGMSAMNPQMMQQMQQMQQQMMQQMQQRQQQGGNGNSRRRTSTPDDIHLVINSRQNSIIVNAPPDKIVVIAEAVKMFDVPPQPGATFGANFQRVKVFRLAQLDPKALQAMLLQAGNLDPTTQLVADDKNKALIAYATPADQITIEALISKLDGTGRKFKVIRLRRLQADYVAGSIQFMMGSEEEEDDSNSRRGYYSFYGYGRQDEDKKSTDQFRVDADVVNNRLLLWANDVELEAVENLLVQLGEIPSGGDSQRGRLRTLDLGSSQSAQDLVKKLKEVWPQVSSAPLKVEVAEPKKKPEPQPEPIPEAKQEEKKPASDNSVRHQQSITVPVHLAVASQKEEEASDQPPAEDDNQLEGLSQKELMKKYFPQADNEKDEKKPSTDQPVVIQIDENGRMTLASENPAVLDLLEDILLEMTPPPKDYEVFKLKHAPALYVSWNLEDFFEEEEEEESAPRSPWFWDGGRQEEKEDPRRLSQRAPIKFLADIDTNTILVQNASAEQLVTIRELIELYDKPEPVVEETKRLNATYAVRYSRASAIAESVKEVFRDLLSSNDKSLQAPQQQQGGDRERNDERSASDYISRSGSAFRGKLSIGVDDISNTLLISAEGESLMTLVTDMVKRIDESAKQVSTVRVVNLKTGVGGDKFRELLNRLLEKVDPQQQMQQQQQQNQNGQNGVPQQNFNGQRGPRNWQQNRGGQPQAIESSN